ncbi:MAG TPA: hypothetical protein VGH48_16455 [Caldimonas sp.]
MIAELGDFGGIDRDGRRSAFSARTASSFAATTVLVTNLAFDLGTAIAQLADQMALRNRRR